MVPSSLSTVSRPDNTTVYSSNSGRCPGSDHPVGLSITAIDAASLDVETRPTNSAMVLGGVPGEGTTTGLSMSCAIGFPFLCFCGPPLGLPSTRLPSGSVVASMSVALAPQRARSIPALARVRVATGRIAP